MDETILEMDFLAAEKEIATPNQPAERFSGLAMTAAVNESATETNSFTGLFVIN